MRGLFVIPTGAGGDELLVATALLPSLDAEHFAVAARPPDPAALAGDARAAGRDGRPVVVSAPGGLLAPLTPRYSVRDLAVELGLPVLVAARNGPGCVNAVRLTAEAARAAGLAVAAVVLTGWPDPPSREALDERALLGKLTGGEPHVLGDGAAGADDAAGWPAHEWLDAAPLAVPGDAGAPARAVVLEPYVAWDARPVGDPRSTPRPQMMAVLSEIIGVEGPLTATRAYALYNRAAGGKKLTTVVRAPLTSAVSWLAQERKVTLVSRDEIPWQDDDVVRMPDHPRVRLRELGPRTLEEVPLDEVAELIDRLCTALPDADADGLKRAVLSAYGLVRLTARADEYLELALGVANQAAEG